MKFTEIATLGPPTSWALMEKAVMDAKGYLGRLSQSHSR